MFLGLEHTPGNQNDKHNIALGKTSVMPLPMECGGRAPAATPLSMGSCQSACLTPHSICTARLNQFGGQRRVGRKQTNHTLIAGIKTLSLGSVIFSVQGQCLSGTRCKQMTPIPLKSTVSHNADTATAVELPKNRNTIQQTRPDRNTIVSTHPQAPQWRSPDVQRTNHPSHPRCVHT